MVEPTEGVDLAANAREELLVRERHGLNRNTIIQSRISRAINNAHATPTENIDDLEWPNSPRLFDHGRTIVKAAFLAMTGKNLPAKTRRPGLEMQQNDAPLSFLRSAPASAYPGTGVMIADSSLARDRRKVALYAAAEIPECWIIDLSARAVETYSAPSVSGYTARRTAAAGEVLRPIAVPETGTGDHRPDADIVSLAIASRTSLLYTGTYKDMIKSGSC